MLDVSTIQDGVASSKISFLSFWMYDYLWIYYTVIYPGSTDGYRTAITLDRAHGPCACEAPGRVTPRAAPPRAARRGWPPRSRRAAPPSPRRSRRPGPPPRPPPRRRRSPPGRGSPPRP